MNEKGLLIKETTDSLIKDLIVIESADSLIHLLPDFDIQNNSYIGLSCYLTLKVENATKKLIESLR
jgi:hypothetical protein